MPELPALAPVIGAALRGLAQWFATSLLSNGVAQVANALQLLEKYVQYLADIMGDVFAATKGAEDVSRVFALNAADDIEKLGADVRDITTHTYRTVIPRSMSWLVGYIVSHLIDPIRLRIAQLQHQIDFLLGWRHQIVEWRNGFVDPNIMLWIGFRKWFDAWPRGILFLWHEWLQHPGEFGQWATPPIVGPLIGYLNDPQHAQSRDVLSRVLVRAWREEPDLIWSDIEAWLLAN